MNESLEAADTATSGASRTAAVGIRLESIVHRYGSTTALDALSVSIRPGSFTVIVGPSGSGKSTALRIIAGLDKPCAGRVLLDDLDVTDVPPGNRDLAMVFQDYALYPHMTVARNIGFALERDARHRRREALPRPQIAARVDEICAQLGLNGLQRRHPGQLSGGQRQRVALARAIARRPALLLLDEPLSSLDARVRQQARAELIRLHRSLGSTVIMVTHDQDEALSMATELVLLDQGRLVQAGTPEEVYDRPIDTVAAGFLGSPAMNLHEVGVTSHRDRTVLTAPGLAGSVSARVPGPRVLVGWRAAAAVIGTREPASGTDAGLRLDGAVDVVEYTGDGRVVVCSGPLGTWTVTAGANDRKWRPDMEIAVRVPQSRLHFFDPATGERLRDSPHQLAHRGE